MNVARRLRARANRPDNCHVSDNCQTGQILFFVKRLRRTVTSSEVQPSPSTQKFDLSTQAGQCLKSATTPKHVFLGIGVLVVIVGLWLLIAQVPMFNLGAFGVAMSGAIVALGFAEVVGAFLVRPPKPGTGVLLSDSQLVFQRDDKEIRVAWKDPALHLVFGDVSADPRLVARSKGAIRFSRRTPSRMVGAVPRECFDGILSQARFLILSVRTNRRSVGVLSSRHTIDVVSIGPSAGAASPSAR
jgi:hypothetical protein